MISVKTVKKADKLVNKLYKSEYHSPDKVYVALGEVHYDLDENYVSVGVRWGVEHDEYPRNYHRDVIVHDGIKTPTQLAYFIVGYMFGIEVEEDED